MSDRHLLYASDALQEIGQVGATEIMPGIDAESQLPRGSGSGREQGSLRRLLARAPRLGIGLGIQLDPIRANRARHRHASRISVHEQTDSHTQRLGLRNDRSQAFAVLR